jgi:hypothetical protein
VSGVIDKIDGLGNVRSAQPVKRAAKAGSSGSTSFAKQLDETGEPIATASVSSTASVNGIFGIQEVDDALAHASKGKQRANDILDRLDELRLDLLAGGISKEKLMQLGRIVAARRATVTDPTLVSILDEIDLRAQVELAKYSQS